MAAVAGRVGFRPSINLSYMYQQETKQVLTSIGSFKWNDDGNPANNSNNRNAGGGGAFSTAHLTQDGAKRKQVADEKNQAERAVRLEQVQAEPVLLQCTAVWPGHIRRKTKRSGAVYSRSPV